MKRKTTIIIIFIFYLLSSVSFSQSKEELIIELKKLNQNMANIHQTSKEFAQLTSTTSITDIKNQIHTIKKKLKTYSINLDNPIFFDNNITLDQNVDLLDFYVYEYSTDYCEVNARLKNKQRKYLEWVKLRYNIYSNGKFIGTDYTYIDFETYGYTGISPYKYTFIQTYIDKAHFDSIAYQIEYDVADGKDDILWDQILYLQSVVVQSSGDYHKWQGVINNNYNYSMLFPKIYACIFKDNKMISTDFTYLDVQNDSLPAKSSGVFDSYINLPSDYDEIKYFLNYSLYSLKGSGNLPPNIPIFTKINFTGLSRGNIPFEIFVIDPNNDHINLSVDFGDSSTMNWINNLSTGYNTIIQHSFKSAGQYPIKAKSKDGGNLDTEWSENIRADILSSTSPKIIPSDLATAYYKKNYSIQLMASGGFSPYSWQIVNSSLPIGLTLNSISGVISGSPTKSGKFNFNISVRDDGRPSQSDTVTFNISVINNFPIITSVDTLYAFSNSQITYAATANDPDGNLITFDFIDYPSWLSKTSTTLYGITPNTSLDTSFSVIATDGELNDTLNVMLIVNEQTDVLPQKLIPKSFLFYSNYPNPFNPNTNIKLGIPIPTDLSILIIDIHGRIIDTIFKGKLEPGYYNFKWHAMNIPSGTYFITLQSRDFSKVKKCLLLK